MSFKVHFSSSRRGTGHDTHYYIFLPFITVTAALNCIMAFSVIVHTLLHRAIPEKEYIPDTPESLVLLLLCYNGTRKNASTRWIPSSDKSKSTTDFDQHRRAIIIVCDGDRVHGPDTEKTTVDYLLDDILIHESSRDHIRAAHAALDHT